MDIINLIKTFDGDIWGNYMLGDKSLKNMGNISCRIDKNLVHIFLRFIYQKYVVIDRDVKINEKDSRNLYLLNNSHKFSELKHFILDIKCVNRDELSEIMPDFDINGISENNECQWIRNKMPLLDHSGDKYNFIKNRIIEKKFCVLSRGNIVKNIENAIILIKKGYTMDDYLLKNETWIVAHWFLFVTQTQIIRTAIYSNYCNFIKNDECYICLTKFQPHDIIINLRCYHNFHWKCCNFTNGGLCEWLKIEIKNNCPYCRCQI